VGVLGGEFLGGGGGGGGGGLWLGGGVGVGGGGFWGGVWGVGGGEESDIPRLPHGKKKYIGQPAEKNPPHILKGENHFLHLEGERHSLDISLHAREQEVIGAGQKIVRIKKGNERGGENHSQGEKKNPEYGDRPKENVRELINTNRANTTRKS